VNTKKISRYVAFFHDGEILKILHKEDSILLILKSAEISENMQQDFILSKDHRLVGILHLDKVSSIIEDNNPLLKTMHLKLPENDILHLEILPDKVLCEIGWRGFLSQQDYSSYEITAQSIRWENIPNLQDPFSIRKYAPFFHDGSYLALQCKKALFL